MARTSRPRWATLTDDALLDLRLCDLGLAIEKADLADFVDQLHDELAQRHLRFRPHTWLSNDWFTPVGVPGIAIPFYLAHPRLKRLEKKMLYEVEGGTRRDCMRILRHEAGHAIQHAYRLNRKRAWRKVFGSSAAPYPDTYQPKPYSRHFVQHLDNYYAQAHPDEDFAETFAVWLTPGYPWRRRYQGWGAHKKLEFVDSLMKEIAGASAPVRSRRRVDPLSTLRYTLREHYAERTERYAIDAPDIYSRDLRRLFSEEGKKRASTFLRAERTNMLRITSRWTGAYQYTIGQVYDEMIDRCDTLALHVGPEQDESALRHDLLALLSVQVMNMLHEGGHRLTL
jgi:hypothetical protein